MNFSMTKFCKLLIALSLFLVVYPSQAQNLDFKEVEKYLERNIENDNLVGVFVGHLTGGGEVTEITKGTLRNDGSTPVTAQSIFEIGSISKVYTTMLLAELMQEEGITLDETAEKYMPKDMTLPDYKGNEILIRHLVTHTSGLPSLPDNLFPEDSSNPYADYRLEDLKRYLSGTNLTRLPGSEFEYSNLGLALVGHILETVTGKEYEQLIIERIVTLLNMEDTKIDITATDSSRLARGHAGGKTVSNWDLPVFEGAGALRSTGNDMMKFLKAQMGITNSTLWPYIHKTQQPLFDIEQGLTRQMDKIGMGWFHATDNDTIIWHSGGTGGYRSFIGFNKETGSGAIVLSNSNSDISDLYFHLLDNRYKLKGRVESISLASEDLERFVGEYKSDRALTFYVTKEGGQLYIRLTGQPKMPVNPISESKFVHQQVGAEFDFDTTGTGRVTQLTLLQSGQKIPAKKISDKVSEPKEPKAVSLDETILRRYPGTYQLSPNFSIRVTLESGQLKAQATGQQKFDVFPESKTKFFYRVVNAQLEFIETEDGSFDKLKLYQGGRVLEGRRVNEEKKN